MTLAERIKAHARGLGFQSVGILRAAPTQSHAFYQRWLAAGYAGQMGYLARHAALKVHPVRVEPAARSVIALTCNYNLPDPPRPPGLRGRISRYARGRDYHLVLRDKLARLGEAIAGFVGRPVLARPAVDSAPLMERELAARAGLGWVGKNANLIHWEHGSWLFLAELLVDLDLPEDPPRRPPPHPWASGVPRAPVDPGALLESCGSCTACIEACPTGAIVADKTVDARRCISYLTIELKGPIPRDLRPGVQDWVFGCDVCQTVCPWNREAPAGSDVALAGGPERAHPSLPALLAMDAARFRASFGETALTRTRRRGLLRNAAIVLGNLLGGQVPGRADLSPAERAEAQGALVGALGDPEPLVRGAAAWALGQVPASTELTLSLRSAAEREADPLAAHELAQTLRGRARVTPGRPPEPPQA